MRLFASRLAAAAVAVLAASVSAGPAPAVPYRYAIVDLGTVGSDTESQGEAGSPGGRAAGNSFGEGPTSAFAWSRKGGAVGLPSLADHPWTRVGGVNDAGTVVGTATTSPFGFNPLPVAWQDGALHRLPLPRGYPYARAYDVNDDGEVVGSAGGNGPDRCTLFAGRATTIIAETLPDGSYCADAYAINDAGRVAGFGIDPNNAARNVAFVVDSKTGATYTLGGTPGRNGGIAFGVSEAGHVAGVSTLNQGDGVPFVWTEATGMVEIPLPRGTSSGEARGVNSAGWVVGYASSAYSIPFVYDGRKTYRLADLLPAGSGWDLSRNTSSAAMSISERGVIIGTGVHDGLVRGFAMIPKRTHD